MSTIKSSSEHLTLNADGASKDIKLQNNGSESARIDSSGNLLVGTTDDAPANNSAGSTADNGFTIKSDGNFQVAKYNGTPAYINRTGNDGTLTDLRKDGSTVGSIGTYNNDIYWGTDDTGLTSSNGSNALMPFNPSTVAVRDAGIDLGINTVRFKDLYLSGGVRLGGTGTANALEDYEEGTWTPVKGSGITENSGTWAADGFYTKVGNVVTASLRQTGGTVSWSANGLIVTGLPFTAPSNKGGCGTFANCGPNLEGAVLPWGTSVYCASAGSSQTQTIVSITYIL